MRQEQSNSQFSMTSSTTTGSLSQQQSTESQQMFSKSSVSKEVYEATASSGAMRGYQIKGEEDTGRMSARARDSGLFGGISGDDNSLVDSEFDYKKHSVKDLAQHFAQVKPKADIPHTILPEQRMYNGDHGPALNYLTASKSEMGSSSSTQSFMKKEISQEDFEASKQAYEMKKKRQQQAM